MKPKYSPLELWLGLDLNPKKRSYELLSHYGPDLSPYLGPGVYVIFNVLTHTIYVGQSINVMGRLSAHKIALENGRSEVPSLQADWVKFGPTAFKFYAVLCSDKAQDLQFRRWVEAYLLCCGPCKIYNRHCNRKVYLYGKSKFETDQVQAYLNPQHWKDLNVFDLPGLYAYVHKITGKVYVGSSARIFSRLGWHMGAFKTSRGHRNSGMQHDVNMYGAHFYVFLLDTRPYLDVADLRLTQEHVWIHKLRKHCYNEFYMKYIDAFLSPAVYVHGVYYESAYSALGVHYHMLWSDAKKALDDKNCSTWIYAQKKSKPARTFGQVAVRKDGVWKVYSSRAAAARDLGLGRKYVTLKFENQHPDYVSLNQLSALEKEKLGLNVPSILKSDHRPGRMVSIDGKTYPSQRAAMADLGLSSTALQARLKSPLYPTYFYVDGTEDTT